MERRRAPVAWSDDDDDDARGSTLERNRHRRVTPEEFVQGYYSEISALWASINDFCDANGLSFFDRIVFTDFARIVASSTTLS